MFGKTYKSFARYLFVPPLMFVLVSVLCGCGVPRENQTEQEVVHVAVDGDDTSGKGTLDAPYATVSAAASAAPASIIVVHEGDYGPIQLGPECSGNDRFHTIIRPAEDEKVLVHAQDGIGISLLNVSNITVEGLEIDGGTHGIYFESTREAGQLLTDIQIKDCTVHGVRGTHGICAYARNDLAPVQGLTIEGCEVYDCECGDSESVVLNGNIDGYMVNDISGNACCEIEDEESWTDEFGPTYQDRAIVVDGFRSLIDNVGSSFVPDEKLADLYTTQMAESR